MKRFKGLSPLVASVLLVAFTMAIAAVIVTWVSGFTQQQTETIGNRGNQQTVCSYSGLSINRDDVSVLSNSTTGDGSRLNVTIIYSAGTETLNITGVTVRDANGITYVNITAPNLDATVRNIGVGTVIKLTNYILSGAVPAGVAWREIKVTALCQSKIVVTGTATNL